MAKILERGLQRRLAGSMSAPVVIIEGARATGKTTLAREWADTNDGAFVDLTREDDLRAAVNDGEGFIEGLRTPCVIDEAQLAPRLTLDLKRRVDRDSRGGQFLLTGSARLSSDSLGGGDPLAGRASRLRLFGLTQGEMAKQPVSIIQWLHDHKFEPSTTDGPGDLLTRLYTGGLPIFGSALGSGRIPATLHRESVGNYVTQVLRDSTLGSQLDRTRILDLFRVVAGSPGMILNIDKLAKDLRTSRETLAKHLAILEQYFLVNRVPALGSDARRELMGHPRIFPADTAFTPWIHGLGRAALESRTELTGGLVHAFVVNELLAQASWGDVEVSFYHWRQGEAEVDLVMRFEDSTVVAIEVKASSSVNAQSTRGLEAFLRPLDASKSYGVVFYGGDEIREIKSNVWAVPISALWEESLDNYLHPTPSSAIRNEIIPLQSANSDDRPTGAALFLSYVRADDEAEHGRITQLARDLVERYRLITGEELQLFIDKDSILWGEEWQARINTQLLRTTFFVPVITPRFLKSVACRDEVGTFERTSRVIGTDAFILPILWNALRANDESDEVANVLRSHNWDDWTSLKYEDRTSGEYNRRLDKMATRLADAVEDLAILEEDQLENVAEINADAADVLDLMEQLEAAVQSLPSDIESWQPAVLNAFNSAGQALNQLPTNQPGGLTAMRAALAKAARIMSEPASELDEATLRFRAALKSMDDSLSSIIGFASRDRETASSLGLVTALQSLADEIPESFNLDPAELRTFVGQIAALGKVSREMRSPTRALSDAVLLITDVEGMFQNWRQQIAAL